MRISLDTVSKRFGRFPVFAPVTGVFEAATSYAILGSNGSGKSTLLRMLAGMQNPSVGSIKWSLNELDLKPESVYRQVSLCAPGVELVEELTLREMLRFHFSFKHYQAGLNETEVVNLTGLSRAADKPLADYSSGMKQRVKLALAIFSNTPLLLLDEPCTNLDDAGVAQYHNWVAQFTSNRLVIVASNDAREYDFCRNHIQLSAP